MADGVARYNQGYNVGVGGAVVVGERILLVRRASNHGRGNWQIPGGFCERDETLEAAVVREVAEETGVQTEVQGIIGLRSRIGEDGANSTYVVFLLRPLTGEPVPGDEVDAATYVTMEELDDLDPVPEINRAVAARAIGTARAVLQRADLEQSGAAPYRLWLG